MKEGSCGVKSMHVISFILFVGGALLGRHSTTYPLNHSQCSRNKPAFSTNHRCYGETKFTPLKEIKKELEKSDYIPKIECELCLSGGTYHTLMYLLGLSASGPVLEEGSFCGCSTAVLAAGLKDAAQAANRSAHPLVTADAFPVGPTAVETPNQYREVGEGYELFVWNTSVFVTTGNGYRAMKNSMIPTIERDGSVLPCLMRTLHKNKIHDFVTVIAGSSFNAPNINYRVIFTDATHNMEETLANEPVWSKHLFNGYPVIILFHDVAQCCPDVSKYILDKYKPTDYILNSEVFAIEVDGQPLSK